VSFDAEEVEEKSSVAQQKSTVKQLKSELTELIESDPSTEVISKRGQSGK
jgi:hypothetical protein